MKLLMALSFFTLLASCSSPGHYERKIASDENNLKKDTYQVGEIKISLLKPDQFRSLYGSAWVLMDGSNQEGTLFAKATGMTKVPDARGAFLRMQNNGRNDGLQNPDKKDLGDFQADEFKSHTHGLNYSLQGYWPKNDFYNGPKSGGSETAAAGGNETRPKNITVNYFIKVSNCASEELNCL